MMQRHLFFCQPPGVEREVLAAEIDVRISVERRYLVLNAPPRDFVLPEFERRGDAEREAGVPTVPDAAEIGFFTNLDTAGLSKNRREANASASTFSSKTRTLVCISIVRSSMPSTSVLAALTLCRISLRSRFFLSCLIFRLIRRLDVQRARQPFGIDFATCAFCRFGPRPPHPFNGFCGARRNQLRTLR